MAYTFYMLAERSGLTALLVAAGITATAAIASLASLAVAPTVAVPTPLPPKLASTCPTYVRAAMHVGQHAELECMPVGRGTFVVARYHTTELWERMAIVGPDGTLTSPISDQPSPPVRASLDQLATQYASWHEPIACE